MLRKIPTRDQAPSVLQGTYRFRRLTWSIAVSLLLAVVVWNATATRRRIWVPAEVPIAFWSWRLETPSEADVNEAVRQTGARTLFLRAGQIDCAAGKLIRIRPVSGPIPHNIAVNFVYNATPSFLKDFEQIGATAAAGTIIETFIADLARAESDGAQVVGLQLDFDVPTRLLLRYSEVLRNIRARLPNGLKLSITGLPTWLDSRDLKEPLSACDFWVPQCYGARIPEKLGLRIPIATSEQVAQSISKTRDIGLPFYAGLAAYGYAIHYSRSGAVIGLRGDLDPLLVGESDAFELTDQTAFFIKTSQPGDKAAGEWRSVYRARRDVMIDGTAIRAGESLLLDRPTSAGLRDCARKVREQAGERLLGVCIFRIPTKGDSTTLSLPEIASALNDVDPRFVLKARLDRLSPEKGDHHNSAVLELENNGAVASKAGDGALIVLMRVPSGCLESVSVDQTASAEPVFESRGEVARCALRRANAVRLSAAWWPPGATLRTSFEIKGAPLDDVSLSYVAALDDGSKIQGSTTLTKPGR